MSINRGWEQTKENIQPLASGRRMAYLAESLRTAAGLTVQQQCEEHHLEEARKLEETAALSSGPDPLHNWLDVVKYMEQHFPNMSHAVNAKYVHLLKKVVHIFFEEDRYKNDKRFVELFLNSEKERRTLPQGSKQVENLENANPQKLPCLDHGKDSDRENRLEPSKWNVGNAHLNNPAIPEPPEKLQLYSETDSSRTPPPSLSKTPSLDKRVLKERKADDQDQDLRDFQSQIGSATVSNSHEDKDTLATGNNCIQNAQSSEAPKSQPKDVPKSQPNQQVEIPRRNFNPSKGKSFFENIKYKQLPPNGVVNRIGLKEDVFWARLKAKKSEQNLVTELRRQIEELTNTFNLERTSLEKLAEQLQLADLKLMQRDEKIKNLETQNEELVNQLPSVSTQQNVQESRFHRETRCLEEKVSELNKLLEQFKQELQNCKTERDSLIQEKMARESELQRMKDNESSEYEGVILRTTTTSPNDRRPIFVDVRSRSSDNDSASTSAEQGTSETSRFNSGETTCAANSFMPADIDMSIIGCNNSGNSHLQDRRALVDRPGENDMMNNTPASAPPMDFEIPPMAIGFGCNLFKRPTNKLSLYESFSLDTSLRKRPAFTSSTFGPRSKRIEPGNNEQENLNFLHPPKLRETQYSDENAVQPVAETDKPYFVGNNPGFRPPAHQEHNGGKTGYNPQFLRPDLPSYKKPTFQSNENVCSATSRSSVAAETDAIVPGSSGLTQRLALLSTRPLNDYYPSDEEEDVIVRRHQQTGVDLNMSNLTTALMLGPKPLTNSTPEREKSQRDIRGLVNTGIPSLNIHTEIEEIVRSDSQGGICSRVSRFNSVLNDEPGLNLSTIQETSRESRSRSTTGSSSGNTMSSTRFGITGINSATPFYGISMTRSSSIPRSASVSQQHYNNNNGYYSDTNAK